MDSAVLVDRVAFGFEERGLGGGVGPVEATVGGDHPPPGEIRDGAQHVGDGLAAAWTAELDGQVAVGDELSAGQRADGLDDGSLEGRGLVVVGPRRGVRRRVGTHGFSVAAPR
jgi:hypothetical protein